MKILLATLLLMLSLNASAQLYSPNQSILATSNPSTNNVGIGVASPSEKLVVDGNIKLNPSSKIFWDWSDRSIEQYSPDGGTSLVIRFRNSMSTVYGNPQGGFDFANNLGTSALRIINGKVGIGTIDPDMELTVNGRTRTSQVLLDASGPAIGIDVGTKQIQFLGAVQGSNRIHSFGGGGSPVGFGTWLFKSQYDNIEFDAGEFSGTPRQITFKIGGDPRMFISVDGNVYVGKFLAPIYRDPAKYIFNVDGKVRANEIVVNTSGADFVFQDNYELRSLSEVESFIQQNNHLPGIPSAEEMQREGMAVGELETKLLEKIEELTLYVIDLKKEIDILKKNK